MNAHSKDLTKVLRKQDIPRFHSKYKRRKSNQCWLWEASLVDGYGQFSIRSIGYRANRVAYLIAKGKLPTNQLVRHTCRNPRCVNPRHLKLGSHTDNRRDAVRHGTAHFNFESGANNPNAKLTTEEVKQLRLLAKTHTQARIASIMGLPKTTVSQIIRKVRRKVS